VSVIGKDQNHDKRMKAIKVIIGENRAKVNTKKIARNSFTCVKFIVSI